MRADGTAANKAAADGTGGASTFMDCATHNGETFSANDVIKLDDGGGSFTDAALIPPSSGTDGNPITYQPAAGETPVIHGADTRNTNITVSAVDWIDITGITCTDALYYGIKIDNAATNINVTSCTVSGAGNAGIAVYDESDDLQTDILIDGNTCTDCVEAGIAVLEENDNITISNNICHSNATAASGSNSTGIRVKMDDGKQGDNIIIESNTCYGNGIGVTTGKGFGFYIDTLGTGCIIRYNVAYDNYTDGMVLEWTDSAQVHYNIFYENGRHGFSLWRRSNSNAIYNNVSYNNNQNAWGGGFSLNGPGGEGPTYTMSNNLFKNNISDGHDSAFEIDMNGGMHNPGTDGTGNVYEYNCFGAERSNFIYWGGTGYATYDAYLTASSQNDNNVESAPSFVDAANGDFRLQADSPCIDAGADVGLTRDHVGTPVPQ